MIESWFPTLFSINDLNFKGLHEHYIKQMYEVKNNTPSTDQWECDTYGSFGTFDLRTEPLYKSLIDKSIECVNQFAKEFGIDKAKAKCNGAWFNISAPGNFQEFHMHAMSHFSAVYYVKTPLNCGNIIFKSHEADTNMFLLPYDRKVPSNWSTMFYPAIEGRLIIFRSNLQHMVAKNMSKEDRISIAMNFKME